MHPLDHHRLLETDLAYGHGLVFLQVRPWSVDHGDVVLLVALNGIRLGELYTICDKLRIYVLPRLALWKPQVDVCAG